MAYKTTHAVYESDVGHDVKKICCIIIMNPACLKALQTRSKLIKSAGFDVLFIDNSKDPVSIVLSNGVNYIYNGNENGIAGALNAALNFSRENIYKFLILFDQDTEITEELLCAIDINIQNRKLPIISIRYINSATKKSGLYVEDRCSLPFPTRYHETKGVRKIFFSINSGSIINLNLVPESVHYDPALYVDCVDVDFCLALRKKNMFTYVDTDTVMLHDLGNRENSNSLLEPPNYSMYRFYILGRSKRILWLKWILKFPLFIIMDILIFFLEIIRLLIFSKNRYSSLINIAKGMIGIGYEKN